MCRQQHEAFGTRIIVLRPDYIVDGAAGVGRFQEKLPGDVCGGDGWVCRHDLAEAVRLALTRGGDFDVLHCVSDTAPAVASGRDHSHWAPGKPASIHAAAVWPSGGFTHSAE